MTAFVTAPSIAWGPGAVEQLSSLGARRTFVLVDHAVRDAPALLRTLEELDKGGSAVEVEVSDGAAQQLARVGAVAERMRRFGPDWVVAIGGGTTLDGAKAARLWMEQPDLPLTSVPSVVPFPERPGSRFVAIPTTSGSGAEASWTCDLFAPDGSPWEIAHRGLVPEWALVDPAFAAGLESPARLAGGLETLAIATEAFVSAWSNPFSDALALGAVVTVVRDLPLSLKWTDEPDARASLHYAATMAGIAASNAQRGVAHALARALVGPTGLPYGMLLGVVLPAVLEFDRPAAREKLERAAQAVTPPGESGKTELSVRLRRLGQTLGAPRDLAVAGIDPGAIAGRRAEIIGAALRSPGVLANPRVPQAEELGALLDLVAGTAVPRPDPPRTSS